MPKLATCLRCRAIVDSRDAQVCWFCNGELCNACWEAFQHCGHPEAIAINMAARIATPQQRRALTRALNLEPGSEDLIGVIAAEIN